MFAKIQSKIINVTQSRVKILIFIKSGKNT